MASKIPRLFYAFRNKSNNRSYQNLTTEVQNSKKGVYHYEFSVMLSVIKQSLLYIQAVTLEEIVIIKMMTLNIYASRGQLQVYMY